MRIPGPSDLKFNKLTIEQINENINNLEKLVNFFFLS
jgi:hypothetical protein